MVPVVSFLFIFLSKKKNLPERNTHSFRFPPCLYQLCVACGQVDAIIGGEEARWDAYRLAFRPRMSTKTHKHLQKWIPGSAMNSQPRGKNCFPVAEFGLADQVKQQKWPSAPVWVLTKRIFFPIYIPLLLVENKVSHKKKLLFK